jgi:hypothetical protein
MRDKFGGALASETGNCSQWDSLTSSCLAEMAVQWMKDEEEWRRLICHRKKEGERK